MQHITDDMIDAAVSPQDAQRVLEDAFRSFGSGKAAMQQRIRTEAEGVKLSTLGAVIPEQKVAGAKVYTACSLIAARHLARPQSSQMALFGAGVQGRSHAIQMAQAYALEEIRICDPYAAPEVATELQRLCGTRVRFCEAAEAVAGADIVVTASRSTTPLFSGDQLKLGCFVAAIGSSLPHTRELDDRALERAACIAVEWLPQTLSEAGDLVLARPGLVSADKLVELGALVIGQAPGRQRDDEITLYKSVGVGLEDVALAGLAWHRLQALA